MTTTDTDLDAQLEAIERAAADAAVDPWDVPEAEDFRITTPERANWALRKVAQAQRRLDDAKALVASERQRLAEYLEAAERRFENDTRWCCDQLEAYARQRNRRDGTQTLHLPNGELWLRKQQPQVQVMHQAEFVAWARDHRPDLLRWPEPQPALTAIKEALEPASKEPRPGDSLVDPKTGEKVPALAYEPGRPNGRFLVRPNVDEGVRHDG